MLTEARVASPENPTCAFRGSRFRHTSSSPGRNTIYAMIPKTINAPTTTTTPARELLFPVFWGVLVMSVLATRPNPHRRPRRFKHHPKAGHRSFDASRRQDDPVIGKSFGFRELLRIDLLGRNQPALGHLAAKGTRNLWPQRRQCLHQLRNLFAHVLMPIKLLFGRSNKQIDQDRVNKR